MKKKISIFLITITSIFLILFVSCGLYLNDYYHADTISLSSFTTKNSVEKQILDDNTIIYSPEATESVKASFIFYPGGKVEYLAYEPLMKSLASEGIMCVLIEMPFNLAILNSNAASGIQEQFPAINEWYIGGHSLGGSMAAAYIENSEDIFNGLILLASYSLADISKKDTNVLSVYGSEDKVLNHKNYVKNKTNLPADFTEVIINGGCHAYFGMYGAQDGDGTPTISNEEQIKLTTEKICEFIEIINS